jgi:hypothetical protein
VLKVEPTYVDYFHFRQLKAGKHYVSVRSDLSDLEEKAAFVLDPQNKEAVQEIVTNANNWCRARMIPASIARDFLDIWDSYVGYLDAFDPKWTNTWAPVKAKLFAPGSPYKMEPLSRLKHVSNTDDPGKAAENATGKTEPLYRLKKVRIIDEADKSAESVPENKKPVLYFHVGLHKTGTTFLQCALCSKSKVSAPILLSDNFLFVGTCPSSCGASSTEFLAHSLKYWFSDGGSSAHFAPLFPHDRNSSNTSHAGVMQLPELGPDLIQKLEQVKNRNVILIFEETGSLSQQRIAALANYLLPNWDVHVIVAYRRLYEWLPSLYNQRRKYQRNDNWPSDGFGSPPVVPFDLDDRAGFSKMVEQIESLQQHPAETVLYNYQKYFPSVSILDFHNVTSSNDHAESTDQALLQYFLCSVITSAPQTCDAASQQRIKGPKTNPSFNLDYDLLALTAYRQKLLPKNANRRATTQAMERWVQLKMRQHHQQQEGSGHENTGPNDHYALLMPQQCLSSDKLSRLEALSTTVEQKLFPWTEARKREHDEGFRKAVGKGKFCSVNATEALKLAVWHDFFQNQ